MPNLVRKQLHIDASVWADMERLVRAKGGPRKGTSLSNEVTLALRQYIQRQMTTREEAVLSPIFQRLLDDRFAQLEAWLRPGVWGGATYGTTAALLLLELMCGKTLDPRDAKDHFELIRGRAWKIVRRDQTHQASGALRGADDS